MVKIGKEPTRSARKDKNEVGIKAERDAIAAKVNARTGTGYGSRANTGIKRRA